MVAVIREGGKGGGVLIFMPSPSRIPKTSASLQCRDGTRRVFTRTGRHHVHQGRSAVRCSAGRKKGEPRPSKNHLRGGLSQFCAQFLAYRMKAPTEFTGGLGTTATVTGASSTVTGTVTTPIIAAVTGNTPLPLRYCFGYRESSICRSSTVTVTAVTNYRYRHQYNYRYSCQGCMSRVDNVPK